MLSRGLRTEYQTVLASNKQTVSRVPGGSWSQRGLIHTVYTVKNVMSDLRHQSGILGTGKSSWTGKLLDFRTS